MIRKALAALVLAGALVSCTHHVEQAPPATPIVGDPCVMYAC